MSCVPSSFQGMGTAEATLRMDNMEVKDEWQDEDFPRPLPEDGVGLTDNRSHPPTSLHVGETLAQRKRRTLVAPDMNLSLDRSEGSVLSDDFLETPDDLDINVDDIETPDETDSLEFMNNGNELEWEDDTPVATAKRLPGESEEERDSSGRLWRTVIIGDQEQRIDMQVIRPYLLRLRKNLKCLIIVHPTWFIRTVLAISRPFISVKFMDKIRYVQTLDELSHIIPMEHVQIPDCVLQYDDEKINAQKEKFEQEKQTDSSLPKERPKSAIADVSRDI